MLISPLNHYFLIVNNLKPVLLILLMLVYVFWISGVGKFSLVGEEAIAHLLTGLILSCWVGAVCCVSSLPSPSRLLTLKRHFFCLSRLHYFDFPPSNICTCFLSLEKIILALRHMSSLLKEDTFFLYFLLYISNAGQRRFITTVSCHIWAPVFWKGKRSPSFPLPNLVASRSTSLLHSWLWLCQCC